MSPTHDPYPSFRLPSFEVLEPRLLLTGGIGSDYVFEFSLDIGSDHELSDPFMDGDEAFDPGDVYQWQGPPVLPPGQDGILDDATIFGGVDPWPDAPDDPFVPPDTRVPVGMGGPADYGQFFDLDGHDRLAVDLSTILPPGPLEQPLVVVDLDPNHIFPAKYLFVSFDDDQAIGWPVGDVPVTAPSPIGGLYGQTATRDEIVGVNVNPFTGLATTYAVADEALVHGSLAPNPADGGDQAQDDDVDSLDIHAPTTETLYWYFSADHEANKGLNPGAIFMMMPGASVPVMVVNQMYLGLAPTTDIDAFEFAEMTPPAGGPACLVLLFSVDDDDPLTPADESGLLNPNMIYYSFLTGTSMPLLAQPLSDDIDALTVWRDSLEQLEQWDFGDAPEVAGAGGYATTLANNGARHLIGGPWLGDATDSPDGEPDGQPDPAALGDDLDITKPIPNDDEDGVQIPVLVQGQLVRMSIEVSDPAGLGGWVDGWIDFNGSLTWDPWESIISSWLPVGVWPVDVRAPLGSVIGQTFARVRINSQGALGPTGPASDGEVEDHAVWIELAPDKLDFGDAPDSAAAPGYPTLLINNGARHVIGGERLGFVGTDAEGDGQPVPPGLGDDLNNGDDEDGVNIPALIQGVPTPVGFEVIAWWGGNGAVVEGWIDFNGDQDWTDPGEWVVNGAFANGTNVVWVTAPVGSIVGTTYARFRISMAGTGAPTGLAPDGEVEDYAVWIEPGMEQWDFGDAPDSAAAPGYPTLLINNGARHAIGGPWLGPANDSPDTEPDGQPDPNALGDDNDILFPPPNDDEDGVVIPVLVQGQLTQMTIEVSDPAGLGGWVDAWIDFDGSLTWDAWELVWSGLMPPGVNVVGVTAPVGSIVGRTFARVRINRQGPLGPTGPATDGEVEDHAVWIHKLPDNAKWVQWPDLTPNGIDIKGDGGTNLMRVLADDFQCTETSLLTDVHLWGSWLGDIVGEITNIHLSIHKDDPVGDGGMRPDNEWSMPGELLWDGDFDNYEMTPFYTLPDGFEYWWDPYSGELIRNGDKTVWQIDVQIDPSQAFIQRGTPDAPVIYWLDVHVDVAPVTDPDPQHPQPEFGWKTRQWPDHFMDDAVWWDGLDLGWQDLHYPPGHPYEQMACNSIDMAFMLTFEEVTQDRLDFGDAPELAVAGGYATTLANNGARHVIGGPWLGPADDFPDAEPDGQPEPNALGDDNDILFPPANDDEDGVAIPVLVQGQLAPMSIEVSDPAGLGGWVDAWIDFDGSLTWDPWELVWSGLMPPGINVVGVTAPVGSIVGRTFARVRINSQGALASTGPAGDGEVEDHAVWIEREPERLDFGDAPDSATALGYPTLLANNGARHVIGGPWLGNVAPDAEGDGQPVPAGLGDDLNPPPGIDDEDGVNIPALAQGVPTAVSFLVNSPLNGAVVEGWIDFNGDQDWTDPGEQVVNGAFANGNNVVWVTAPAGFVGTTYARFRISMAGTGAPTGLAPDGEVEDYSVLIEAPLQPKWEQPPVPADPDNLFYGWNEYSVYGTQQIAADDWVCSDNSLVSGITWWGSYLGWTDPTAPPPIQPDTYHFAIWTDVPVGADNYFSHPGQVLWEYVASDVTAEFVGWDFDPRMQSWESTFRYHVDLPTLAWFQQLSPKSILWLSVAAGYETGQMSEHPWGWKTLPRDPESPAPDAAVQIFSPTSPMFGSLYEMGQPITFPSELDQWDLAFELQSVSWSEPTVKWTQPPDLNPTGIDVNASFGMQQPPYVLADDFKCTQTGYITEIGVYGSWYRDMPPMGDPNMVLFTLSLHADIPAEQSLTGYSMPGEVLWLGQFGPGQFRVELVAGGLQEGWLNPPDIYDPLGDTMCWRYVFDLPAGAFIQRGTPENPVIYWLDVQATQIEEPMSLFGWKTSINHNLDAATWTMGMEPVPPQTDWNMLVYPEGHLMAGPIDLAFEIVGQPMGEEQVKWSQPPAPYDKPDVFNGWDEYSVYGSQQIVADDWLCTTDDPIQAIQWWGSFLDWGYQTPPPGIPQSFYFSIWSDVPADPEDPMSFSHPGTMLWDHVCEDYTMSIAGWDIDPRAEGLAAPEAKFAFYQELPEEDWFYQEPGEHIYWISISAMYGDMQVQFPFGWETRPHDPASPAPDDAVRIFDPTDPGFLDGSVFPVPDGKYVGANDVHFVYFGGSDVMISNFSMVPSARSEPIPLPPPGETFFTTDSFFDVFFDISLPGEPGMPESFFDVFARIRITGLSDPTMFQTELLAMDLSGGSLPPGFMLRESPTLASHGQHTVTGGGGGGGGGGYNVDSFFDIFFEISLDGGQTWVPANAPLHVDLAPPVELFIAGQPIEWPQGQSWDMSFTLLTRDTTAPQVTNVAVSGTGWTIAPYDVPVGSSAQLDTLPWGNIDQVSINFSEDVNVALNDFAVVNRDGVGYFAAGVVYDPATFTATWTLTNPLSLQTMRFAVADTVGDQVGNRLDGDWTDTVSVYPSGDGVAGGAFLFGVNVLPGDANQDGVVSAGDYISLKRNFGRTGDATWAQGNFDGDDDVDWYDLQIIMANFNNVVPPPSAIPMGGSAGSKAVAKTTDTPAPEPVAAAAPEPVVAAAPEPVVAAVTLPSSVAPAETASTTTDYLDEAMAAAALESVDALRTFVPARPRDAAAQPVSAPMPRRRAVAYRPQFDALLGMSRLLRVAQEPDYAAPIRQDILMSSTGQAPADIETDLLDVFSLSKLLPLGVEGL